MALIFGFSDKAGSIKNVFSHLTVSAGVLNHPQFSISNIHLTWSIYLNDGSIKKIGYKTVPSPTASLSPTIVVLCNTLVRALHFIRVKKKKNTHSETRYKCLEMKRIRDECWYNLTAFIASFFFSFREVWKARRG